MGDEDRTALRTQKVVRALELNLEMARCRIGTSRNGQPVTGQDDSRVTYRVGRRSRRNRQTTLRRISRLEPSPHPSRPVALGTSVHLPRSTRPCPCACTAHRLLRALDPPTSQPATPAMAPASHLVALVTSVALRASVYVFLRWVSILFGHHICEVCAPAA